MIDIIEERSEETREINKISLEMPDRHKKELVGKIEEAPEYLIDNEFIKKGYRINFKNFKSILRSLFMVHNELINIWSHLLGALIVIFLIFHTASYVKSHKNEIIDIIDSKWDKLNEELKSLAYPIYQNLPNFKNLTYDIKNKYDESKIKIGDYIHDLKNKTFEYFNNVDEKLTYYKNLINEPINCVECVKNIIKKLSDMKDSIKENIEEMKKNLKDEYEYLFQKLHIDNYDFDIKKYIDDMNEKIISIKEEILEKLDSNEMEWIDIYSKENNLKIENKVRRWPLFVFLISAIICLGFSATFHLFYVHSCDVSYFLGKMDYAGISLLIAGSCYPPYYYLFFCNEYLKLFYLGFITILSVSIFIYSFNPDFGKPHKRRLRGFLFLTLGISAGIPIFHILLFSDSINGSIPNPNLLNWMFGGMCYIGGCLIYVSRLPEKRWPGKFCIIGSSHQIWHLLVFCGIIFHFFGSLDSYHDRLQNQCG